MDKYYTLESEDVLKNLKTSEAGLTSKEAEKRLKTNGLNELPKKEKDSTFKIVLNELIDPIVLLLWVAVIFSFLTGEKTVRNEFGQIYIHADSRLDKDDALSQTGQKV